MKSAMRERSEKEDEDRHEEVSSLPIPSECDRLHRSLADCLRQSGRRSEVQCRHLNRALAECILSAICPDEAEAVRSLCSSAGTSLKRAQCQKAQIGLSACLSAHQQ